MSAMSYQRVGTGPALVLIHGYLGGSAMWQRQLNTFSHHHDVICPDLAGFGRSASMTAPHTIEGHAHQVLSLLDKLGIDAFDLLGHSMGGMVVQEIARLAPDRVDRLVLYGTGPQGILPGRFETIAQSREKLRQDGISRTAERIAATWFLEGSEAESFSHCCEIGRKATLQAALASLDAWESWDGRAKLADIRSKTLVLWGSHDRSYSWSQPEALWKGIAGADLAVVPNCAHNVHQEKPEIFDSLLADFLGSKR